MNGGSSHLRIVVSGCHSGPSPSPGVGVSRSLREAFPEALIVAKDHSVACSGFHAPSFDEVWVCRPWQELDLEHHLMQVRQALVGGGYFISGLDLEAMWLSRAAIPGVLVPPADAMRRAAKPGMFAFSALPAAVPRWCPSDVGDRELHAFARHCDWRVWVKGPAYEARLARSWAELCAARAKIGETWGTEGVHVQADVRGNEVSLACCALDGRLLDAVFAEKRVVTEQGKTWAADVSDPDPALLDALRDEIARLGWTGGLELEFVRDHDGALWLIDANPRFPAWIHGATIAGRNLPAQLVAAASGVEPLAVPARSTSFTRIVWETPVRDHFPLPPAQGPTTDGQLVTVGKHPSGMPQMRRRMLEGAPRPERPSRAADVGLLDEIAALGDPGETPARLVLEGRARARFEHASALADEISSSGVPVRIAYSLKTNPSPRIVRIALQSGQLAEVISELECSDARRAGFGLGAVVYNGPVPAPRELLESGVGAAFADSVEALRRYVRHATGLPGVRLRPLGVESRFGVEMDDPAQLAEVAGALADLGPGAPFGVSTHVQSSVIGLGRWEEKVRGIIWFARALEQTTDRTLDTLDLGGGWEGEDLDMVFRRVLPGLVREARATLPGLRSIVVEPGKSLVEECGVLLVSVVELRRRAGGAREAVVDGSMAELPMCRAYPHRVIAAGDGRHEELGYGDDRILGRLCLEDDVLREAVRLPDWLREGDRLWFRDSGAYDASMSFSFGQGFER